MKTYDERLAAVKEKVARKRRNRRICAAALTLVLALVLLIPYSTTPPSVRHYSDSEYYNVISKINELTYEKPQYKNTLHAITDGISSLARIQMSGAAPMEDYVDAMPEGSYVEVTDNQVAGVTEADIFKRSDKYIFYLQEDALRIYSIAGEESALINSYRLKGLIGYDQDEYSASYAYVSCSEMYLSMDCTTVTLVIDCYSKQVGSATLLMNLDVTDVSGVRVIDYVYFPGFLISTRMVDGQLLLTYNYKVRSSDVNYGDPETFVPSYGKPGEMTCIAPQSIVCPDTAQDARYTVICRLDGKTLEVEGSIALLGYSQELYVSQNALYATLGYTVDETAADGNLVSKSMTQVSGIGYSGDGLQLLGSVQIEGSVPDQYAMDEYEGILRLVANTAATAYTVGITGTASTLGSTVRNVNLYCVDLSSWEVAACVEAFAPQGERAESVRFDGEAGYVCTAEVITLTDPVYFFDLSDVNNITWTDTGTIDGYSTSLIQLGDGLLMGIGYGDQRQVKIEIYEQYEDAVVSVACWELEADYSEEYKSYFIDREQKLLGLAVRTWNAGQYRYYLLHFDGYQINELLCLYDIGQNLHSTRACLIDDEIYILTDFKDITVEKIW